MQKININGVDIEINVPTAEEMTLLKGQLEAAKKVISDLKKVNTKLTQGIYKANQEIEELKKENAILKPRIEITEGYISALKKEKGAFLNKCEELHARIKDLQETKNAMAQELTVAKREIQTLRAQHDHLKKDMEGTVAAYEGMRETAKENQAACQVLRDKLNNTKAELNAANFAVKYWQEQFNAAASKIFAIKRVLK